MKSDILKLIRITKEYISMDMLKTGCNMSEGAIKTSVNQLIEAGYDIEYDKEKGYHMNSYPENISSTELLSRNNCIWAGKNIFYRKEVFSTNEEAKMIAEDGKPHGSLIVAENQVAGKGRKGRSWVSDGRNSIAMSLLLRPTFDVEKASMVKFIMALAVADVLSKLTTLDVKIKWPNDVIVNNKKVCGILTEMGTENGSIDHIIVGVGINVNQKLFSEDLQDKATSLFIEKGERYSRADIILAVLEFFEYYYDIFVDSGDLSDVVAVYEGYLVNKDKEVKVFDPKGEYKGIATGINDYGELVVQKEDGKFVRVSSGEVSVRGVYGYV